MTLLLTLRSPDSLKKNPRSLFLYRGKAESNAGLDSPKLLLDMGYVIKPKNGWYMAINPETKEELTGNVRMKDTLEGGVLENTF